MILEGAIGDAYGAGFEFAEVEKIRSKNTVSQYETHPLFEEIQGKYTDDTQMTIAIAELLISGAEWNSLTVAQKFVEAFKRDPRRGYAKRFYKFLEEIEDGSTFLEKIKPKSDRNGAAMRAYPLGVLGGEKEIIEKCNIQSEVTHQTEKALLAAQAIALASHYFIYKKGKQSTLIAYLQDIQGRKWEADWSGPVNVDAVETVEAVLTLLVHESSLQTILKKSVDFGG
ncbi:MAG: ADP-ribosylglycohydrolase family protein, partial [Bacteroidota bacterium]